MGHAILNRLIGLVNKTLKMSFFSRKLSFSQLKLGFGSMTPEKTDLIEGRQQLNLYPETLFYLELSDKYDFPTSFITIRQWFWHGTNV